MKVIKRNGSECEFDVSKIEIAIQKANKETDSHWRISPPTIKKIAQDVADTCEKSGRAVAVEEIQDMVEEGLMKAGAYKLAHNYTCYRYERALVRKANTTDERILSLVRRENEEDKQENSNKNPIINSTQRDYIAGEVSRDITNRILLPKDIVRAHEVGIIHFHDSDYFLQNMTNCCLVNLEDMLQNGTSISGVKIDKPHTFATACNIATQALASISSNQFGIQNI